MTKKTFKPIVGSLEKLTEQERLDYVNRLCEHLEVPADLGLVDLGWQDGGDGGRVLLPFVRKGAAEIIRSKHGISVTGMIPCNGEGYVAFMASAQDKTGRQEISVGAVNIKGLSATKTADAVMWAQTRASRRVTLQFVGGGVLDESELNEKTTDINAASSLKEIAAPAIVQPTVQPNAEAGNDVTPRSSLEAHEYFDRVGWAGATGPALTSSVVVIPAAEMPPVTGMNVTDTPAVKRPRGRPRKNVVSLDSPDSTNSTVPTLTATPAVVVEQEAGEPAKATPAMIQPLVLSEIIQDDLKLIPAEPPFVGTRCTDEQKVHFRKRRSDYVNDILPKGGFLQSEKLGSRNDKFMLFVQAMFPKANIKQLSLEQWEHLFGYLDRMVAENLNGPGSGAVALVKNINQLIGETA